MAPLTDSKRKGIIGTILFHLILLIVFLFTGLTMPVPLPDEKGLPLMLDLGNVDFGSGEEQPQSTQTPEITKPITEPLPVESAPLESPDEVATQEEPSPITEPEQTKAEPKVEKKPQIDERLKNVLESNPFQTNQDNDSKGEGDTDQPGDHGNPEGSPQGESLFGDKAGGGVSYELGGRVAKNARQIPGNYQESGVIWVDIVVDREGNVIRASAGRGTTITNAALLRAAEAEARRLKFTPKADAPAEQRGRVKYPISLQ
ncbi:MAG: hypothetical protein Kow0075_08190 [Salibacteraceae bacterium]